MASRYGLEIRRADGSDAAALAELLAAGRRRVPAAALTARLEALSVSDGVALIALEWAPPSGLIVLHWLATLEADLPTAHVSTLLVAPDARRRGVGRMLLKAGSQAARAAGCGEMQLSAPADDDSLSAFCRATGFDGAGAVFTRQLRKRS